MRFAIVEAGETVNVIVWDGETPLMIGEHQKLVPEKDAPPMRVYAPPMPDLE